MCALAVCLYTLVIHTILSARIQGCTILGRLHNDHNKLLKEAAVGIVTFPYEHFLSNLFQVVYFDEMPLDLVRPLKYLKASLQMISIPHFSGQGTQESRPFSNKSLSYTKMSFSASRTLNVPVFPRLLGLKQLPKVISAILSGTKWT